MSLKGRMDRAELEAEELNPDVLVPPHVVEQRRGQAQKKASTPVAEPIRSKPLTDLKIRAQKTLFQRLGHRLYDRSLDVIEMREMVKGELDTILEDEQIPLSDKQRDRLIDEIASNALGLGPIESLLQDDSVSEIMVIGDRPIFIERNGRLVETNTSFISEQHLRRTIERIVSNVGRRIDESSPMVDARLDDGSRINAVIPPLAVDGSMLTVRKFARTPFTVDQLIGFQTLTEQVNQFIELAVRARITVLISGGTGTGKTTLLNVLSSYVGDGERIVSIEDSVELQLRQRHVARLESRPSNIEGKGEVTIRDLVRNALRMRPDRIIVGEVRGGESLDMLQAMNTGHDGSLTTLHANTPRDALARLETMVLMAGMDLPHRAIREQIASAINLVIQISRLSDGTRRIVQICEVTGMEGDIIQLSDLFAFDWDAGIDPNGKFKGSAVPTGIRPTFERRIHDLGLEIPANMFGPGFDPRVSVKANRSGSKKAR